MGTHFVRGAFAFVVALTIGLLGAAPANAQPVCDGDGTATLAVNDILPNETGLLPLSDWSQLYQMVLTGGEDVTLRRLVSLGFLVKDDPADDRSYQRLFDLRESDILEFAIFREGGDPENWGTLDADDRFVTGRGPQTGINLRFDVFGNLTEQPATDINSITTPLIYNLNLTNFNVLSSNAEEGQSYIVAVRTSKTWRSRLTLAYTWFGGLMRTINDTDPVNDDCTPAEDSYPEEPLDPETAYSASFGAWDITSGPSRARDVDFFNAWAHPRTVYTPLSEYHRPRFDVTGSAFDFVAGEFVELRELISLENWKSVIGIDAHGGSTLGSPGVDTDGVAKDPVLKEVNVILTDIGADPLGPPGNGGFNPVQGLETHVDGGFVLEDNVNTAVNRDFTFNGVWVFYDTNNDGFFDQPTQAGGSSGVSLVDHPMFPEGISFLGLPESPDDRNSGLPRWEYVPFPPGGGDPWWKIRLRFSGLGRRRDVPGDEAPTGLLDPTPDSSAGSPVKSDYFVVVRPDSGYQDSQALPGDGIGLTHGADFRAFIEPRRENPNSIGPGSVPQQDGGIFISSQIPDDPIILEGQYITAAWQENALWENEPWFPERTLNKTNAKPVRTTVEIHDLAMTYESSNLYSKLTDIDYGSGFNLGEGEFTTNPLLFPNFSTWLDPLGTTATQFQDVHAVGVVAWATNIAGVGDHSFNVNQYSYETTPFFHPDNDLPPFGPRSQFLPTPPTQPTLPTFFTWPATLGPDEFPHENDWSASNRRGRYLKQHIEALSRPTAMIGINITGADDIVTNQFAQIRLQQLTVAFWGPDFDPSDLLALDVNGTAQSSGVLLVEDGVLVDDTTDPPTYGAQNGVFGASLGVVNEYAVDTPVPLASLRWRTQPELIDVDGDGVGDDMN
ncbi:MAG TPA: hypothetical protein PK869_04155, partial [Candidatus Hydrogenedentes bacterium]|nr:hypothetical protein [Candidatus Hydrogenedentota bacterium]